MSDDIPSLAEAMAENRRLRVAFDQQLIAGRELLSEIQRLRARILELEQTIEYVNQANDAFQARNVQLEAAAAVTLGTLEPPPAEDEPAFYTHDVKPNAPPHGE